MRILIAEDDRQMMGYLSRGLKELGHLVVPVAMTWFCFGRKRWRRRTASADWKRRHFPRATVRGPHTSRLSVSIVDQA